MPWIEFSERLNLIYLGLILLGIGTILYKVFAPSIIKDARDINDYVVETIDNVSARNLQSMFATIHSRKSNVASTLLLRAPWLDRKASLKTASNALKKADDNQIKIDVLRSFYTVQDRHTARIALYCVLALYSFGFFLLAIPGLAFTGRVLCVVSYDLGIFAQ